MATVVAENIEEAWEVRDTLCVGCVRAHVCIEVEELELRDCGKKTKMACVDVDEEAIQRQKQVG